LSGLKTGVSARYRAPAGSFQRQAFAASFTELGSVSEFFGSFDFCEIGLESFCLRPFGRINGLLVLSSYWFLEDIHRSPVVGRLRLMGIEIGRVSSG